MLSHDISSTWYTDFFTELPNEFWRRAATPAMTRADLDFIESRLMLNPESRILDVPCGSGRHSLALAQRGYRVTGVDISSEAVDHARRSAAEAGLAVTFELADMREIPGSGSFDAALCLGNSFGYLDIGGTREFVAALARAVRPGGGLVIDFNCTAETILPGFTGAPRTMRTGDIVVEATTEYDVARSRLISHYAYTRGDDRLSTTAIHHIYTSAHIGQLLSDAGFVDVQRFGGPDCAPFELGSGRFLLTAQRG